MTFHDDPDLERRLRRIAESPQPPVPGSVYRYASEVTSRKRGHQMRPSFNLFSKGRVPAFAGLAAALVIAVAVAGVLISVRNGSVGNEPTSSPSASATSTVEPVATPTESPTPAGTPAPTMNATGFTTTGVTAGWTGFSWSHLAAGSPTLVDNMALGSGVGQVLRWRGGYVATGSVSMHGFMSPSLGLWTSPDGKTWTPVTSIDAPAVLVSIAPGGLVAIGLDPAGPSTPGSAWTSSDGLTWHDAGASNLPGALLSIAGTDSGIVATVVVSTGTGKQATETALIEFSTDGVNWTPETVGNLNTGAYGFGAPTHVQTGNGRFFLMGTVGPLGLAARGGVLAASLTGEEETWWSDDGRTWTRSGGEYSWSADYIDFGRDGLLLHTNANAVPGAQGLAWSGDGGKTWQTYDTFGPLGTASCQGECATGPDGLIASNGSAFLAVKNGGQKAWLSYDGHTWTPIPWAGPDPQYAAYGGYGGAVVMPRGVLLAGQYGAAK
jgi:hypothetical protein